MTKAERDRLYRQRKQARTEAVRSVRQQDSLAAARVVARMTASATGAAVVLPPAGRMAPIIMPQPETPPLVVPPPPLPDKPSARLAAVEREVEAALRQVLHDATAPAPARIAAARSIGELHGLLRARSAPVDGEALRQRERGRTPDAAELTAFAESTAGEIARLEGLLAAAKAAEGEAMPWD